MVQMVLVLVSTTVERVVVTWTEVTPLWVAVLVTGQLVTVVYVMSVVTLDTVETGDEGVIGELGVDSDGEGDSEGETGELGVDSAGVVVSVVEVTGVVGEFGVDCSAVEGTVEGNMGVDCPGVDATGVDCTGVDCTGVDCTGVLEEIGAVPDGGVVDKDGAVGYLGVDCAGLEDDGTGAVGTGGLDGTGPVPTGTDGEAYVEGVGTVVWEVAGVDTTGTEVVEGVVGAEEGADEDECGVQSNPTL